ncbi:hypothetical protein C8F01DRAFT_997005, partial [Mycena amicta]
LLILVPVDEDYRCIVIPHFVVAHEHPFFSQFKTPYAAVNQVTGVLETYGPVGATAGRLTNAPIAAARGAINGKLLSEIHPSLVNKRRQRQLVSAFKQSKLENGTGIRGVLDEYLKDQDRPPSERYFHAAHNGPEGHVVVTMEHSLAHFAHSAAWIMVDTTFAIVVGTTNEWKILVWSRELERRIVLGRIWSNSATRAAFRLVWNGIFDAIHSLTGRSLNFRIFAASSELLGAIGDSEGAQAQGLGDVILSRHMNTPTVRGEPTVNTDTILKSIWKTCRVHYIRGVIKLAPHIDDETERKLRNFPFLETDGAIREFYEFCNTHTNKRLIDWWKHKISYPWLLPSLNRYLSKMKNLHFDLIPNDTNAIEGSHAADNRIDRTNHTLLEAMLLCVNSIYCLLVPERVPDVESQTVKKGES